MEGLGPDEETERPRPRVVDKRRSAQPSASSTPAPEAPVAAPAAPPVVEAPPEPAQPAPEPATGPTEVWTPEQEEAARQMAEEFARVPSRDWVLRAAVDLANAAGIKLDRGDAADAQLAIDALSGMIKEIGPRLGEVEAPLRQTLAQLQMAYAQVVAGGPTPQ